MVSAYIYILGGFFVAFFSRRRPSLPFFVAASDSLAANQKACLVVLFIDGLCLAFALFLRVLVVSHENLHL